MFQIIDEPKVAAFSRRIQALKQVLGVREDQEVAAALGISKQNFSDRKRRGSFPYPRVLLLRSATPSLPWHLWDSSERVGAIEQQATFPQADVVDSRSEALTELVRTAHQIRSPHLLSTLVVVARSMLASEAATTSTHPTGEPT